MRTYPNYKKIYSLLITGFLLFSFSIAQSQKPVSNDPFNKPRIAESLNNSKVFNDNMFGTGAVFIKNIGQYGETLKGQEHMGKILYAYEGMGMPVLFTEKGIIHLYKHQLKVEYGEYLRKEERELIRAKPIKAITIEWENANSIIEIVSEEPQVLYHTYGLFTKKATTFKKIIYKNVYDNVDAVYSFISTEKNGYEFSLLLKPGADLAAIKMKYGGDGKGLSINQKGQLLNTTIYGGIIQSAPLSYYKGSEEHKIKTIYTIDKNSIGFGLSGYDRNKTLIIDPFVSTTGTLTGINSGLAKDIDFDYDGNVYVSGGGDGTTQKLAKYSAAGTLLWTFSGSITTPFWNFGGSYGGWVVDKGNGNIFLGQGLAGSGFSVIRLNSAGVYDNYITTANSNFTENWKMIWSCNGGTPKILIAGGGGSADNELALLPLASTVPSPSNLSGLTGGHNDISDIVIDPVSNDMFTIYSRPVTGTPNGNIIYKHPPPYTSSAISWQKMTTFNVLREPSNRPYLSGLDNSSNTLAVNANYLFYWDGKNLSAYNKADGTKAGTDFVFSSATPLITGGVFADACGNVFIGYTGGVVKVLTFNGSLFNDNAAPDINIAGASGNVFDLAYDDGPKTLYISGNGFVAAVDVSPYCPSTHYTMNVAENCLTKTINATVTPQPPSGTSLSYAIYDGTTLIASNTTGNFSGLLVGVNYTVKAFLNQACGGTQLLKNFAFANTASMLVTDPAPVCMPDGTANITLAAVTAGSEAGLSFTYWQDANATIPYTTPAAAKLGTYYIKGIPADTKCPALKAVVVAPLPVPVTDAGIDTVICFGNNTQLNALPGAISYTWSPAIFLDNPAIRNPMVVNPKAGTWIYHLIITDANGCKSLADEQVTVFVTPPPKIGLPTDTLIVKNQPLQLNADDLSNSGITNYLWSPPTGLSDPFIKNPVAITDKDIMYRLDVSTAAGCKGTTYIIVKVYDKADIYVPSAFTPGGNGLNDLFKAIPVGMKEFHFLTVYNRWGQMVFTTTDFKKGWDGTVAAKDQATNVYVWIAEAVDYKGNLVRKKGTVTLIR